jgi:uncharacterized protein YecT (DUF1311 family)
MLDYEAIRLMRLIAVLAAVGICMSAAQSNASENDDLRVQNKRIEEANADLDLDYQRILAILDGRIKAGEPGASNFKNALVGAERAWIKWRDAEAVMRAYSDGAVGGSALMEDVHSNLIRLINERREFLQSLIQ